MPKISIIVPVYKVEKFINRCVDSILAQTFTDFEVILVDDGSPDNCGVICDEYARKDSRVIVIHQKNGGLSAARNAGIDWTFANSDSEWITFIDSDDWIHPRYLEMLINSVQNTGKSIAVCSFERTEGNEPIVNEMKLCPQIWETEDFYFSNTEIATVAWGKLYSKKYFKDIRYPLGKIHEDEYVTYRILFENKDIAFIDQPLYAYYQNTEGITHSVWGIRNFDVLPALRQQLAYFRKHRYKKAYIHQVEVLAMRLTMALNVLKTYPEMRMIKVKLLIELKLLLICNMKSYSIKGNEIVYKKAFPYLMELYWILLAQLKKRSKDE